jgi:hypothetical protein
MSHTTTQGSDVGATQPDDSDRGTLRYREPRELMRAPRHPDQSFHGIVITHSSAS